MSGRHGECRFGAFVLRLSLIGLLLGACGSDRDGVKRLKKADAYVAAINWYVDSLPAPPPTTDGGGPGPVVVYVVNEQGGAINSDVQASVVSQLAGRKDDVTVRFADVRDDALQLDVEDQPVKEDGVLLLVGDVDERPPPLEFDVDVYRNLNDEVAYTMKVSRNNSQVTATAQTVGEQG